LTIGEIQNSIYVKVTSSCFNQQNTYTYTRGVQWPWHSISICLDIKTPPTHSLLL